MRKMVAVFILLMMLICAPVQAAGALAEEMARKAQALTGQGGAKGAILAVVEDGEVDGFGFKAFQCGHAVRSREHSVALVLEADGQKIADVGLVLRDKNVHGGTPSNCLGKV